MLPTFVRTNITFRFVKLVLKGNTLRFDVFVSENGNLVKSTHKNYVFYLQRDGEMKYQGPNAYVEIDTDGRYSGTVQPLFDNGTAICDHLKTNIVKVA